MEQQITWLILTVVLSALTTGVVVYVFQKRTEARYAKREFEDQLKFRELYLKRVKVLEELYQKFVAYKNSVLVLILHAKDCIKSKKKYKVKEYKVDRDNSQAKYKQISSVRSFL